jgi:hypothetical protein
VELIFHFFFVEVEVWQIRDLLPSAIAAAPMRTYCRVDITLIEQKARLARFYMHVCTNG